MASFAHQVSRLFSRQRVAVVMVGVGAIASISGCSRPKLDPSPEVSPIAPTQSEQSTSTETVLVSSDGTSQLTLPAGWQPENELHDSAELQASNPDRKLYVIVLSESKEALKEEEPDTDWTLETHSETTRKLLEDRLKAAGEVEQEEPVTLKIGEYPALQYELRGKLGDLDVVYLHTTVETPTHFHQVLAWTTPEALKESRAELDRVIQSFEEVTKTERQRSSDAESSSSADEPTAPQTDAATTETTPDQAQ